MSLRDASTSCGAKDRNAAGSIEDMILEGVHVSLYSIWGGVGAGGSIFIEAGDAGVDGNELSSLLKLGVLIELKLSSLLKLGVLDVLELICDSIEEDRIEEAGEMPSLSDS